MTETPRWVRCRAAGCDALLDAAHAKDARCSTHRQDIERGEAEESFKVTPLWRAPDDDDPRPQGGRRR